MSKEQAGWVIENPAYDLFEREAAKIPLDQRKKIERSLERLL